MRAWIMGLLLALVAGQAWAEVTLTFYAHPGSRVRNGQLLFPHAYVQASGAMQDSGTPVDWSAGFTAYSPGPQLLFSRGRGVVTHPDPRYVSEGRPFLQLVVSDDTYRAVRARADWWNSPEGRTYDLRRRNCITFIADLARVAGLQTAPEPSMKPGTFLEQTAALNPAAAWREDGQLPQAPPDVVSAPAEPAAAAGG